MRRALPTVQVLDAATAAAGLGYWIWDLASDHVTWSEPALRLLAIDAGKAPRSMSEALVLIHGDDRELVRQAMQRTITGGQVYDVEFRRATPDGERWINARGQAVRGDDGVTVGVVGVAADSTPRRREAAEREGRLCRHSEALVRLSASRRAHGGDREASFQEITEIAASAMGVERVGIWLYDDSRAAIRCADLFVRSDQRHESGVLLAGSVYPRYFQALGTERVLDASDAHGDLRTAEFSQSYLTPLGIGAMLDAPIRSHGRMLGVVCHEHIGGPRPWHTEELAFAGSIADFVALALESAERARFEAELSRKAIELERSNAELEEFAYIASHDLQEPLRMVSSFLALLRDRFGPTIDPRGVEYLGHAVDGAMRMQLLIRSLLEYSRVQRAVEEPQPVATEGALSEALENLRIQIEGSGASVVAESPLPTVRMPHSQFVQLLQNLVGNALKFHGVEPPVIRLSATREGAWWSFAVADNGIGIPPADVRRLFVVFQRLHTRAEYPGTGIGLAICRKLVEARGGRIWVEPNPGGGSIFRFTLPVVEEAERQAPPPA
ncbi:MAG: GAF domain-containing protein [Planctomycetes bacterium]|nr:GAF domain-containing protein [Planctomycetota bacterium]